MNFNLAIRLVSCFSLLLYDGKSIWAFPDYVSISNSVQSSFGKCQIFTEFYSFCRQQTLIRVFTCFCGGAMTAFSADQRLEIRQKPIIFAFLSFSNQNLVKMCKKTLKADISIFVVFQLPVLIVDAKSTPC